ncbi:glycosyl hydrolase family 85 [Clostridium sp. CAG:138]|nr:glycosyl hydrolase family 85 [Clostridium sp. CAG:138]
MILNSFVTVYQVNIGRLAVTDSEAAAASASNARLEEIIYLDAYTAEARIKWNGNNASSYEIYRLNADGTRTLIMETPNTAYYIPNLVRNDDQADVTVEVVPVNANGVRGESSRFTIDWLYENGDTEKLSDVTVPVNICPLAEVTGYSAQNDGEPAWKAIDGTSENGSKWCATNARSGWMTIKLDQPRTIKRIRIEHAEYGGEAQDMNTIAFSVQYKSGNNWVTVYSTNSNSSDVTDELITPVTAQEWRLYISNSGSSAWGAIRIYEWQMFETTERNRTDIVLMKFASAKNNKGASDTFSLTNAPTGSTVRLYLRDANGNYTQIASKEAQSSTVSFTGLDYGSDAGRVFYTVQEGKQEESIKLSTAFDAEPGAVKYSINVVQPANGSVAASATSATAGTTVKLTATPAEGYTLDYFTLDGERINGDTFIMPARNVEVSAVFTANAYSITVVQPANGTVSASATSATAGTTIELTATPAEGYTLDYFTLDGERINGHTFSMPARNVEVSAVFTANAYSITVVQPAGGTVTASKLSAFFGEAVELTAVPDEGYELSHYVVNGAANNGGTFTMPARDVIVTAVFTKVAEPSVNLALNATIYYSNKKYPDYAKNGPQHAFDGKMSDLEADKWHASGINGWVAFDIHTPVANPILKIYHAGSAGENSNLNTSSWDVYILNERYLTEEAYFNMDRSTQNRVCQIAWFWKRIHVTTGNTADISVDHIDMPEARRLFKINMRKTNQTGYPYYLNVYEIEMYAGN